jgi:hypothetical protein
MRLRERSLLDEIERDALNSDVPVTDTLRKVIALGGKVGSTELREWASRELRGYTGTGAELPSYRKPSAAIQVDAVNPRFHITGQQISPRILPDGIRERIDEAVPLGQGIGEIEAMLRRAKANGGAVKLALPRAQDVARIMDHEINEPDQNITAIYWSLSQPALEGAIDQVRTTLVELVAEMRAGMPNTVDVPSAEVADQAVNVAVYGDKTRVTVASAKATGDGAHHVHAAPPEAEGRPLWWTIGAAAGGVATIAGALIAFAQWQGWGP